MIREVIQAPDERLLAVSAAVEVPLGQDMRRLAGDLLDTMRKHKAAGLAAPQIGQPVRMIALNPRLSGGWTIMVNPVVVMKAGALIEGDEGCLSIGHGTRFVRVKRHQRVVVAFTDRADQPHRATFGGQGARAVQHEVDHLDGKLIA